MQSIYGLRYKKVLVLCMVYPALPRKSVKNHGVQSLGKWEEAVGKISAVDESCGLLTVELNIGSLTFPADSLEANTIRTRLKNAAGDTVAILRTDLASQPIAVRILEKNKVNSGGGGD